MGSQAWQKNPDGRVRFQTKRECPFWCVRVRKAREGMQDVNIHSYQFHAWGDINPQPRDYWCMDEK